MSLPYFSLNLPTREPNEQASRQSFESQSGEDEESTTGNDSEDGTTKKRNLGEKKKEKPALGFYINKSGFPIQDSVWERMWQHVENIHPDGVRVSEKIRSNTMLPKLRCPTVPSFTYCMDIQRKLDLVQGYLSEMRYNHTGTQFFEIRKNRPLCGLMETAKEMIKESLPIKCLEATILSLYLTNGICGLQRFTIGFKTYVGKTWHSHVVLGVYFNNRFGALGLSRRDDLMYKPVQYTLIELIDNYRQNYNKYFHVLKKVKLSLPIVHDPHSYEHIQWRYLNVNMEKLDHVQQVKIFEQFTRFLKTSTTAGCSHIFQKNCKKDMLL